MKKYKEEAAKSHAAKTDKLKGLSSGGRAKGGTSKGKGKTSVNILIADRGGSDGARPPVAPTAAPAAAAATLPSRPSAPVAPPAGPRAGLSALVDRPPVGAKKGGAIKRRASGRAKRGK